MSYLFPIAVAIGGSIFAVAVLFLFLCWAWILASYFFTPAFPPEDACPPEKPPS